MLRPSKFFLGKLSNSYGILNKQEMRNQSFRNKNFLAHFDSSGFVLWSFAICNLNFTVSLEANCRLSEIPRLLCNVTEQKRIKCVNVSQFNAPPNAFRRFICAIQKRIEMFLSRIHDLCDFIEHKLCSHLRQFSRPKATTRLHIFLLSRSVK